MADTRRSLSTLLNTTFADGQDAGSIDPQAIRDLIASLRPAYGRVYISLAAATTIAAAGTYVKAAGTTTPDGAFLFTTATDNRLTYTGTASSLVQATASLTLSGDANNATIGVAFAKNGIVESASVMTITAGVGSDVRELVVNDLVTMATGDYLEVFVTYTDTTGDITINKMHLSAIGYPA